MTTTTTRTADDGSWVHGCLMVKVGTDFATYADLLAYASQDDAFGSATAPGLEANVKKVLASGTGDDAYLPTYFSKRKCRDSSLGGNDAINPLPQFCVDDDISSGHYYADTKGEIAMGQVYSEHIDDLQQILYLGFGIPLFSNVGSFWASATDMDMANFVNNGAGITLEKIGYMAGTAPIRIFKIATIPFRFIAAMAKTIEQVPISQYYSFASQMPMYFRFVNTILVMLATNMNIVGSSTDYPTTGSNTSSTSSVGALQEGTNSTDDMSGVNTTFRDHGLDMARIMTKRYLYENGTKSTIKNRNTDQAVFDGSSKFNNGKGVNGEITAASDDNTSTNPTANTTNTQAATTTDTSGSTPSDPLSGARKWAMQYFDNFAAAYSDTIYDGHLFIGFRIDKGSGASESFSNQTGESQISQTANEKFQAGREAAYQTMNGDIGSGAIGETLTGVISAAKGLLQGLAATFNLDPLAAVATGAARINIPDVWMSSSWNRSISFTITCMSPYGDFESIFQSEYVPLACILAGTLPRGTGLSSHSAPFVCQAYCRGIFSSQLCMIESLEVVRGADQFGMNMARLPLKTVMHVSLKDLTPVMYLNMGGDRGIMNAIFGTDDAFAEYMMTLSGMGLRDRLTPWKAFRRKAQIFMSTFYKNKLSPFNMGMEAGRFTVSRLISAVVGAGKSLPSN